MVPPYCTDHSTKVILKQQKKLYRVGMRLGARDNLAREQGGRRGGRMARGAPAGGAGREIHSQSAGFVV
eukprot:scaffold2910_cov18-Tisochrysis_lutea.AAC.1